MATIDLTTAFLSLSQDVDLDSYTVGYCLNRLKSEGVSFLTVTLPKLAKHVLLSIELGYFARYDVDGKPLLTCFAWKRRSLRYFRSLLDRLFDPNTGRLVSIPDPLALFRLRQLCEYAYKLALSFSDQALDAATEKFISTDSEVMGVGDYDPTFVDQLRKDVSTFYRRLASTCVDEILHSYQPRSGPGTYSGSDFDGPWYLRRFVDYRTPRKFSAVAWANRPLATAPKSEVYDAPDYSEVLFVPKDSRGPRTIVREPFSALRFQMAYNSFLGDYLERATHHRINFRDQRVNRDLARTASTSRGWATLDLKDASDRVSAAIVDHVFRDCPGVRYFLDRRTQSAKLPDGRFYSLRKLSGMGSGFTFPTMSFLIHLAITRYVSDRLCRSYRAVASKIYVYGDDIILPTPWVNWAIDALSKVGLVVNLEKSYYRGFFRESCGGDYFYGADVTPVRLKLSSANPEVVPGTTKVKLQGHLGLIALEAHCRELVKAGLLQLAEYYYGILETRLGSLPYVAGESPVLGRYCINGADCYLQDGTGGYEAIKAWVPVPVVREHPKDVYIHLATELRRIRAAWWECSARPLSVTEVAKPRAARLVRRSVSAFRLMG